MRVTRWGLGALLLAACGEPEPSAPGSAPTPVPPAPRSSIVDLDGTPRDPLRSGEPGMAVLLFVSTDCPISNRYAPTMRGLAQGWAAQGVTTWLVYPDPDDDPAAIRAHQAEFSLSLPTVRDPAHVLVAEAGARVTPEAAVFGPGVRVPAYVGRIDDRVAERGKVRAQASAHELRDAVSAALAGRPPAAAGGPAIGCYISDLR